MRRQIRFLGKRLAAGLLGAAMLFTAVGVAAPAEVRAAQTLNAEFAVNTNASFSTLHIIGSPKHGFYFLENVQPGDKVEFSFRINSGYGAVPTRLYFVAEKGNGTKFNVSGNGLNFVQMTPDPTDPAGRVFVMSDEIQPGQTVKVTVEIVTLGTDKDFISGWCEKTVHYDNLVALYRASAGSTPAAGVINVSDAKGTETKEAKETPAHTHDYHWETLQEATEERDGEMADICSICGDVRQRVPITGYYLFQKETMDQVKAAAQGATVEIKTSKWISFHRMVMESLASRPDVTLSVSFLEEEYKGARKKLTIPAGTDTNALLNEDGYAGFKYLGGMFGLE